mmetsp:Transcript_11334/g.30528  ORF Transcript_11334/g.30528 Transcript_11334/m.30528 type:complete len:136 (-) Transcript_11334:1083-1490(-)
MRERRSVRRSRRMLSGPEPQRERGTPPEREDDVVFGNVGGVSVLCLEASPGVLDRWLASKPFSDAADDDAAAAAAAVTLKVKSLLADGPLRSRGSSGDSDTALDFRDSLIDIRELRALFEPLFGDTTMSDRRRIM